MRRLTESRPVDTSRQEFFTDAEIFACIATFRLVAASGDSPARAQSQSSRSIILVLHLAVEENPLLQMCLYLLPLNALRVIFPERSGSMHRLHKLEQSLSSCCVLQGR